MSLEAANRAMEMLRPMVKVGSVKRVGTLKTARYVLK